MNNPNPFVPQGSLLEQEKRRSRMKLAVFCVLAISVCGLTAMLIQGCKREAPETSVSDNSTNDQNNVLATNDTNSTTESSNTTTYVPPVPTNPPVVVTPPVEPTETDYVVVKGDTLGKIAKSHGVSLKALEAANPNVKPTRMKVGDKIIIPAATSSETATPTTSATTSSDTGADTYSVKSGDTLTKIAKANGTTVKALESENNLSTTKIKVGQKLKIPANAQATSPTTAPAAPAAVSSMPSPTDTNAAH